ncbi:hypothetical protein LINPERPRIM_LOCUS120 [Linum perenne]
MGFVDKSTPTFFLKLHAINDGLHHLPQLPVSYPEPNAKLPPAILTTSVANLFRLPQARWSGMKHRRRIIRGQAGGGLWQTTVRLSIPVGVASGQEEGQSPKVSNLRGGSRWKIIDGT